MKRRFITVGVILVVVGLALGGVVLAGGNERTADRNEKSAGQTEPLDGVLVEEVRTSDFILSVEVPEEIRAGEVFTLRGTLEYIGEEDIRLFHGLPVIRFYMVDRDGKYAANDFLGHPRGYLGIALLTPLETGQKMQVEDTWRIDYPGEYELIAATTLLANECPWEELFEGKNYERFIRDDMTERVKELRRSKIVTAPIEITVIGG
ncbi:MAG: hypothetical protein IBX67_01995 [Dehalococcoidia bacterium]|nr:hypothetical protein [Dehalococcoidia bacterium]